MFSRLALWAALVSTLCGSPNHEDAYGFPQVRMSYTNHKLSQAEADSLLNLTSSYRIFHNSNHSQICSMPAYAVNQTPEPVSAEFTEDTLERAAAVVELSLKECLYYAEGYWTYAFCYGKEVVQFHGDADAAARGVHAPDPRLPIYYLARFQGEEAFSIDPTLRPIFLSQTVSGGTKCDVTMTPRTVKVKYICDRKAPTLFVQSVREVRTCHYEAVINLPELCLPLLAVKGVEPPSVEMVCARVEGQNSIREVSELRGLFQPSVPSSGLRLTLSDYDFQSLGYGVSLGEHHLPNRPAIMLTGHANLNSHAIRSLLEVFNSAIGYGRLVVNTESQKYTVSSKDQFVARFATYDFRGEFQANLEVIFGAGKQIKVDVLSADADMSYDYRSFVVNANVPGSTL